MRKTTKYFEYTRQRSDRNIIRLEWIESVIQNPLKTEVQLDGRIRTWGWIEQEKKYLRVILLEDGKTLHNAFFDRRFKAGDKK
jgi:hypothetical protein